MIRFGFFQAQDSSRRKPVRLSRDIIVQIVFYLQYKVFYVKIFVLTFKPNRNIFSIKNSKCVPSISRDTHEISYKDNFRALVMNL